MTVIIDEREILGVIVKEVLRCLVLQHEILVHECFHTDFLPFLSEM
jgi:hypothetical protein